MKDGGRGETGAHPHQPNTYARARQLSEMIVSELGYLLAGWGLILCNHSIRAERETEKERGREGAECHTPSPASVRNTF